MNIRKEIRVILEQRSNINVRGEALYNQYFDEIQKVASRAANLFAEALGDNDENVDGSVYDAAYDHFVNLIKDLLKNPEGLNS